MKENGLMIICTGMEHSVGREEKNIKDSIYLISRMERENFIGKIMRKSNWEKIKIKPKSIKIIKTLKKFFLFFI